MAWIDAFAPCEAKYCADVMKQTWGHLAPKERKTYRGHIVFAIGLYGSDYLNPTVLESAFKARDGETLESSPWYYDAEQEFLGAGQHIDTQRFEIGGVYRFDGTFRNYRFAGTFRKLKTL